MLWSNLQVELTRIPRLNLNRSIPQDSEKETTFQEQKCQRQKRKFALLNYVLNTDLVPWE